MLKLKLQYFGHLMCRADSLEKSLMLGKIEGRRRRADRGWDGWMASAAQWTWVWAIFGRWCKTGKNGVLQSMRSERIGYTEWLNNNGKQQKATTTSITCKLFFPSVDCWCHKFTSLYITYFNTQCKNSFKCISLFFLLYWDLIDIWSCVSLGTITLLNYMIKSTWNYKSKFQ